MSSNGRRILLLILAAGLLVRLPLVLWTHGLAFDIESFRLTGGALLHSPLHVYDVANPGYREKFIRWPYPPGFLPWLGIVTVFRRIVELPFSVLLKAPLIAADLGIAATLGRYEFGSLTSERSRLQAAALVALGPVFFLTSGYHGQIDSLAILPALLAFVAWARMTPKRRAVVAGVLVGIGASIKTVPIVLVAALVPSARRISERAATAISAVVPVALMVAPFLLVTPEATTTALRYVGVPGIGGISLLMQPDLAKQWIVTAQPLRLTSFSATVWSLGPVIVVVMLASVALFCLWRRASPVQSAVLIWLGMYAFGPGFFFQYLVWGIPFFLLAARLRWVIALQAAVLLPMLIVYQRPWADERVLWIYVPLTLAIWIGFAIAFFTQARLVWKTT